MTNHELSSSVSMMDSPINQLDDILKEKLDKAYHKHTSKVILHDIIKIAEEHSPVDLAYAAPRLPANIRPVLYENMALIDSKMEFMINTDMTTRAAVFRHISDLEIKRLIESMPPDDAVSVLEALSEKRFRRVMDKLDPKKAFRIREIKQHERNTAGRLMTNEFFAFSLDLTVEEAASFIRENPGIDLAKQVFIQGASHELLGYVPERNLIVNPGHLSLKQVMKPILHKVHTEASREEVVDVVERYRLPALPVVDSEDRLVGVITYEDVVEAMEDITDETIAQIAGTGEKVREHEPTWKRFLARAPWLIVTLCAGLLNVGVMSSIQGYEGGALTFVLFFVPLITGFSGNVGLQCSTVLVRSMATGSLSSGYKGEAIRKEVSIGVFCGTLFGMLAGTVISILDVVGFSEFEIPPLHVGLIVGFGLWGACFTSTLLGVFSPLFFSRMGVDPAIASGPIVTAINDFLSMSIYFLIALTISTFL
ncbi:MAG: magnesium transporter [Candidatus Rhabdochlamydia sp.]